MTHMPLFSYPASVVLVDDDPEFCNQVQIFLQDSHYSSCLMSNSREEIEKNRPKYTVLENILRKEVIIESEEESYETYPLNLSVKNLRGLSNNREKYNQISVLIVDYEMPGLNGIEFCRLFSESTDQPVKKILLTGTADDQVAIEAFNEGIIDKFLKKKEKNLSWSLIQNLKECTEQFFTEFTKKMTIFSGFEKNQFISDPAFITEFKTILDRNGIIEYYALDSYGSFLLKTNTGTFKILATYLPEQIDALLETEDFDTLPLEILDKIKKHELVFYPPSPEGFTEKRLENWSDFIFPAQKIQ